MSTMHSDPLFVRAEVAYRLERYGVGHTATRADTWPSLGRPWRQWAGRHLRPRTVHTTAPTRVAGRPRHP